MPSEATCDTKIRMRGIIQLNMAINSDSEAIVPERTHHPANSEKHCCIPPEQTSRLHREYVTAILCKPDYFNSIWATSGDVLSRKFKFSWKMVRILFAEPAFLSQLRTDRIYTSRRYVATPENTQGDAYFR
ncbi:hypothetical protein ACJJTC_001110 [Scirpophaga incertulas]